ncbi:MAG: hypothetical protein ACFFDT_30880, partial [Candidatus Hodarchaeota archaeon]
MNERFFSSTRKSDFVDSAINFPSKNIFPRSSSINPDTLTEYESYYTDYKSPTATGAFYNGWANPTGAYNSDNNRASEATYLDDQDWYNFGFNIPT